ncbi:tetratricopeptide repeat-containing diguanylate cyclase [Massilia agri]|uniref:diguanylate cyclase n=1 Tax=Massilia agri TaxID=1886785 RepID=A0ABT2AQH4_9BURK|nr:tetratricopeptide repeat-containing diguanylate cyclase [Massilia agri]MCS0598494.1 diguanylate cyclase [Massilia agri]
MRPLLPATPGSRTLRKAASLALSLALASAWATAGGTPATGTVTAELRLRELGQMAERNNAKARSLLLQEGASFGPATPYPVLISYLRLLRRSHSDAGQMRDAYAVDERMIALAAAQHDAANLALASLGRVYKRLNDNDPAAAMALLETLVGQHRPLGNIEFETNAEIAYGAIYNIMGQHDRALSHYLRGLELVQRHPEMWSPREADVRLALARLYVNGGNAAKALETTAAYREARAGRKDQEAMTPRVEAAMHFMDGRAYVALKQLPQAHGAFNRALELARRHELRSLQGNILGNIADAWLKEHRYVEAERAARASIPIAEEVQDQSVIQMAWANLGFALFGQGKMQEGTVYIERVAADLRKAGAMPTVSALLDEQAAALEKAGLYRQALQTVREREKIQESLAVERRDKAFAALQEQFNAKQRAAQIERLRHENAAKDTEIRNRKLRSWLATAGALLAFGLAAVVFVLYRKSQATSRRLAELNAELAYHSAHDPLTGLYNRRSFVDRMRETDAPSGGCFTLLDIDHFKRINDQYGHAAGDAVLVEVGRRLNETVRESDMVLRWGGEEFLVYSQGVTQAQRPLLVQRILNAIAAAPVVLDDGTTLQVSATAGAVSLPLVSNAALGWEQAIALADRALYKGKEAGRNRGFIVEDLAPVAPGAGNAEPGLRLQMVLPDMYWQPAQ